LNIWEIEYDKIVVSEGRITCIRPGSKIAVIEQWMEYHRDMSFIKKNLASGVTAKGTHDCEEYSARRSATEH